MRYNEKELQALSRQPAEMAAELGMRGPKKGSGEPVGAASGALGRAGAVPGWADENSSVLTPPCACSGQEAAGEAGGQLPLLLPPGRGRGRGVGGAGDPRGPEAGAHGRVSRSPSEPCCWSAAEWPRKSRAASLSVSALVPTVGTPDSAPRTRSFSLGASVCPGSRVRWWPRTGPAVTQCPLDLVLVLVSSPTLCPFPAERGAVCELGVYSRNSLCRRQGAGRALSDTCLSFLLLRNLYSTL